MRLLAPLAAAAGAAFIVYQWWGGRPLWVDEEMIAINIRDRSLLDLAGRLWLGQSAPFGWSAVQRAIMLAAGTTEQALRAQPAFYGAATLAAAVWIGRRWMTAPGALIFVALCTCGLWLSFFPLELKHYSADAFWGLMIPALAAWVVEAKGVAGIRRRAVIWWAVAAAAHWLSNGGLFAAPGSAIVLFLVLARRHGTREALVFALAGLVWLASFALYYQVSLTHTHHNPYLRQYWISEFPPGSSSVAERLEWIARRLPALADDPAGTTMWAAFWTSAVLGAVLARPWALAAAFATLPLTAFLLAAAGFVPLYGRFALWMTPAVYALVALAADRAVLLWRGATRRRPAVLGAVVVIAALVLAVSVNVIARGLDDFRTTRAPITNRGLDDRAAARWLLSQRRAGDAVLSTRLGWPALWWYGGMAPAPDPAAAAASGQYQVDHLPPGIDCGALREALKPHTRALVHIGFPDLHEGFGELLLRHLDQIGVIEKYRVFSHIGFAAIVDLHTPHADQSSLNLIPRRQPEPAYLTGCIAIAPATRW